MNKKWASLVVILVLFVPNLLVRSQQPNDATKASWPSVQDAWKQYRNLARNLQGSCRETSTIWDEGNKREVRKVFECKQKDGCASYLEETLKGRKTRGLVYAYNRKYAFELYRTPPTRSWALAGLTLDGAKGKGLFSLPPDFLISEIFVDRALSPFMFSLSELAKDSDFLVEQLRPREQALEVNFTFVPKQTPSFETEGSIIPQRWIPFRKGRITLESSHFFVIRDFDILLDLQQGEKGHLRGTFSYKEGKDQFPILERQEVRFRGVDSQARWETTSIFDLVQKTNVPESEFTLSAFDLPEPRGIVWPRSPSRWWLWFIGLAAISLGLGRFFWCRFQRNRKMLADNSTNTKPVPNTTRNP